MSKDLLLRKIMVHRYSVALLIMAALALVNFWLISSLLADVSPTTVSVPAVGRLRYSISNLGYLSNLLVTTDNTRDREALKVKMLDSVEKMEDTYNHFKSTSASPPPPVSQILYLPPYRLDNRFNGYLFQIRSLVSQPTSKISPATPAYRSVQKTMLDGNLISALDALVTQIQQQSLQKTERLKILVNLMTLTFIIVLALMAAFIFKPLLKNVEVYDQEREEAETYLKQELKKQIAMLAHDLKTPINAENRALKLLADETFGELNETQKTVLEEMRRSNRYLYRMVDNLLTYYKTEEKGVTLHVEPIDIHVLIREIAEQDLATFILDKNQKVVLNFSDSMPLVVLDPAEIYRVLYNLVVNANHYTSEGGLITITTAIHDHNMTISIQDEGAGMSEDRLKTIFQPYQSFSKKYRQVGTGLGLYLSKKIIEAHKGKLTVKSAPGTGTEFTVDLPLVVQEIQPVSGSGNLAALV